ncbi:MAG: AraC family ligand binding domain-containing protein, partial [Clostridia bacterium]|nr:AraC family ligand binding domain-containing protein [Clostridia bacterium]
MHSLLLYSIIYTSIPVKILFLHDFVEIIDFQRIYMELKDWFATNTYGENFIYIRQKRLPFFNVILCGITNPNPDYDVHFPDGCPCYILDYTLSGSGTISDEYGIHTLQEGSLLFIRKGVPVHFQANKDTPFKKIWIQMTGTFLKNMCALFQMP